MPNLLDGLLACVLATQLGDVVLDENHAGYPPYHEAVTQGDLANGHPTAGQNRVGLTHDLSKHVFHAHTRGSPNGEHRLDTVARVTNANFLIRHSNSCCENVVIL